MNRAILGVWLVLFTCQLDGQTPSNNGARRTEFEVASVRAVQVEPGKRLIIGMRGGPGTSDPKRVMIENYPMFLLILEAYHLNLFQVAGLTFGPERYNIIANLPDGTTKEQFSVMLQNLLMDRFKLKVHHETKEMPIFEMTVAKNAPPMKQHLGDEVRQTPDKLTLEPAGRDKDGYPVPGPGQWAVLPAGDRTLFRFNLISLSLPEFAQNISSRIGRTVVDATGLDGKYDFVLSCWVDTSPPSATVPEDPSTAPRPPAPTGPEFLAGQLSGAIQQQLGLRLEPKKRPVNVLVIDHVDKLPSEN